MKRKSCIVFFLVSIAFFVDVNHAGAQDFPTGLSKTLPQTVTKLNSDDVNQRFSIVRELVYPEPFSCTLALSLRFQLSKADYVFVVGKILETDLTRLDEKSKPESWYFLSQLIFWFEMKQFAGPVSKYLDDPNWQVQVAVIETLKKLQAREFDTDIVPFLNSSQPHIRSLTLETLISFQSKKAVPPLVNFLDDLGDDKRSWALQKLAEIDAKEAAPQIAEKLKDKSETVRYWALDALVRLDAKSQSGPVRQFIKTEVDERLTGLATAALLQFEEKDAVQLVIETLKLNSQSKGNQYTIEFVKNIKARFFIPVLISMYYRKERFFESDEYERRIRQNVLNLIYSYRVLDALPIYRENLFENKLDAEIRFSEGSAQILLELNDQEGVDHFIAGLKQTVKGGGSYYDQRIGTMAWYLAKFGNPKASGLLIDVAEKNDSPYRGQIIAELNRQLDPKLWKMLESEILPPIARVEMESFSKLASKVSHIQIDFEKEDTSKIISCLSPDFPLKDAIPCSYSDGRTSVLKSLNLIFSDSRNRKYTWILDRGRVRILSVEKAVEWWRKNVLTDQKHNA